MIVGKQNLRIKMILVELEDIGKNITFFKNTEPLFIFSGYIDEKSGNIINVRNLFTPSVELPDIPYNIGYYGDFNLFLKREQQYMTLLNLERMFNIN